MGESGERPATAGGGEGRGMSPWGFLWRVISEPGRTFARLRERPALLAPYAVLTAASVAAAALTTGKMTAFGVQVMQATGQVPPEALALVAKIGVAAGLVGAAFSPLLTGLAAAGVLALAALLAGGQARFRPLLSMVGYASLPITVLGGLLKAVLVLGTPVEEVVLVTTSAAIFLGREQVGTWAYRLASLLDPFALWTLALAVTGYAAVSGLRVSRAAGIVVPLWAAAQLAAVLMQERSLARLPW